MPLQISHAEKMAEYIRQTEHCTCGHDPLHYDDELGELASRDPKSILPEDYCAFCIAGQWFQDNKTPVVARKPIVIGIAGKMASGKDTMAQFMINYADSLSNSEDSAVPKVVAVRRAFADALKEEVADALAYYYQAANGYRYDALPQDVKDYVQDEKVECTDEYLGRSTLLAMMHDRRTKEHFRLILQWWGTEFRRRQFGDDYWLRQLEEWIETEDEIQCIEDQLVVLVPDVRFPNEADFIHQLGGFCIEIIRPNNSTDQHSSETSITRYDKFDTCFNNEGDLAALEKVSHVLFNQVVRVGNRNT